MMNVWKSRHQVFIIEIMSNRNQWNGLIEALDGASGS